MSRPENRKYHFTYEVTCKNTGRIFYGLYSCDELDNNFKGKGQKLSQSIKEYGKENHSLKILQLFETRNLAIEDYNKLKELELNSPVLVSNHLYHYVYLTTRFDGKYYIGAHSTNKLNDPYKGSGIYIARSLRKYGKNKHTFEILEMCLSREHAFQRESEIITPEILADPLCMNLDKGGQCKTRTVYGFTEETKKSISEKNTGKVRTAEHRQKYSEAKKGIKFSDVHRKNISQAKSNKEATELQLNHISSLAKKSSGKCTVDGITIYESKTELCNSLGHGKGGGRSPNFVYIDTGTKYKVSDERRDQLRKIFVGKPRCEKSKRSLDRKCTVDGVQIFNSVAELIKTLGYGKNGRRSENFRYVT